MQPLFLIFLQIDPFREGLALLQGLVLCGICGKRMSVRYRKTRGRLRPEYACKQWGENLAEARCQSIPGDSVDEAVGTLLVEAMNPVALDVALAVQQELENRIDKADSIRHKQVERVRYEVELARRRYILVDPENRLVADALEAEWNERLRDLAETEEQYKKLREQDTKVLDEGIREKIPELVCNFPSLWHDPATPQRERKRMVHLLVEDVTLIKAYMVDIGEFLKQTGYLPPDAEPVGESKRIPIISWAQAGNWQQICEASQYGDYVEYVETDAKGIFALRVRGDSTETEFHEGDIIVINPYLNPGNNDYVVVSNEEGEANLQAAQKVRQYMRTTPSKP